MTPIAPLSPDPNGRGPVYFLLHLPKTAGQTVSGHLAEHCPPGTYLEPRRGTRSLDGQAVRGAAALSGHWLAQTMEAAFRGREIRRSVLLRDPVGLHLSLYNYRMMNYRAKGLGSYDLALHLASTPRNYLAFCLLTRWLGIGRLQAMAMAEDRQFAILDAMLQDFWFVGTYRDCDPLLARIAADLGVPAAARARNRGSQWQEIVAWQPLREETIGQALAARIMRDNRVDQALWERWGLRGTLGCPKAGPAAARWLAIGQSLAQEARRRWIRDVAGAMRLGQQRRVRRADAARSQEDWQRAADGYRAAIGTSPGTPSLWIDLARALRGQGDREASRVAFDRALCLKPDMPSIRIERSQLAAHAARAQAAGGA